MARNLDVQVVHDRAAKVAEHKPEDSFENALEFG
jgi:hypothetical protein